MLKFRWRSETFGFEKSDESWIKLKWNNEKKETYLGLFKKQCKSTTIAILAKTLRKQETSTLGSTKTRRSATKTKHAVTAFLYSISCGFFFLVSWKCTIFNTEVHYNPQKKNEAKTKHENDVVKIICNSHHLKVIGVEAGNILNLFINTLLLFFY